jgi:hypothetical protein
MGAFGKCEGGGRRSSARQKAPTIAVFTTVSRSHDAELVDISPTGARLTGDDLPELGEDFILVVEGIRTFGSVAWVDEGQCGVLFDGPLPAAEVQALRAKVDRWPDLEPRARAVLDDWTGGFAR